MYNVLSVSLRLSVKVYNVPSVSLRLSEGV